MSILWWCWLVMGGWSASPRYSAHSVQPEVAFYWAWQGGTERRSLPSSVICVANALHWYSDNVDL